MILHQRRDELRRDIDLPAFKREENHIQKLALRLSHGISLPKAVSHEKGVTSLNVVV